MHWYKLKGKLKTMLCYVDNAHILRISIHNVEVYKQYYMHKQRLATANLNYDTDFR